MSINSCRAVILLRTQLHQLCIEVALWHQNMSIIKVCKVCEEGLIEDEYQVFFLHVELVMQFSGDDDLNVVPKIMLKRLN